MQRGDTSVYGIFTHRGDLEACIGELERSGYRYEDISVLYSDPSNPTKEFAIENSTKAPEGAAAGMGAGAIFGATLGWLAGIGAIAIPGVGPFIAAGPIMGLLAGVGVGGAIGTLGGALIGLGIPEYEASRYEGQIIDGGILISVHADDAEWTAKTKGILIRNGARDVASKAEPNASSTRVDVRRESLSSGQ